jgi:hypothetical protein
MPIEVRQPTEEEKIEAATWPEWEKEPSEFPWSRGLSLNAILATTFKNRLIFSKNFSAYHR